MQYILIPQSWANPPQKSLNPGPYECGQKDIHVRCITEDDWKIVIDNKMLVENALTEILKLVDKNNAETVIQVTNQPICRWYQFKCKANNTKSKVISEPRKD